MPVQRSAAQMQMQMQLQLQCYTATGTAGKGFGEFQVQAGNRKGGPGRSVGCSTGDEAQEKHIKLSRSRM